MNPETARDFGYHTEFAFPARRLGEPLLKVFARELEERGVPHNQSAFQDNYAELVQTDNASGERTKITIKPDRVAVGHENVQKEGLVIYGQKVDLVAKTVLERLGVPVLAQQVHVIRKLVNPAGTKDARQYLLDGVCKFDERRRSTFGRPLHGAGLRFYFPATDRQDPCEYDVKVESFLRDGTLLYLENLGKFHLPLTLQNLEKLTVNVERTNEFLLDRVFAFFAQFNDSAGLP